MTVFNGRPPCEDGRSIEELRVYDALDALGICYIRVDHHPAMTMEDCLAVDEALQIHAPKNLFLRNTQKTEFYLLVMPGEKKVHLIVDRDAYLEEYMGCHPCANTSSIKIKTTDMFERFLPFTGHVPVFVEL